MKTWLRDRVAFSDVIVLIGAASVVALTILPGNFPLVHRVFASIDGIRYGDKFGHLALFGGFTFLLWYGLNTWMRFILALPTAMFFALSTGTATEVLQSWIFGRSASISDMLANWLGVFAAGFLISFAYNVYLTLKRSDEWPFSPFVEDV